MPQGHQEIVRDARDPEPRGLRAELPAGQRAVAQPVLHVVVHEINRARLSPMPIQNPSAVCFRAVGDDGVVVFIVAVGEEFSLQVHQTQPNTAKRLDLEKAAGARSQKPEVRMRTD
jgi:hypothetical protein